MKDWLLVICWQIVSTNKGDGSPRNGLRSICCWYDWTRNRLRKVNIY